MRLLFLVLLLFSTTARSYEAVVIVLEAPLLKEPRLNSTVLQLKRKGTKVYIPNEIVKTNELPPFLQTYDRVGNVAYIPSRYIKLITNDLTENKMPISLAHDPTDYRLEEPIPASYPFDDTSFLRASAFISFAPNPNPAYKYRNFFNDQDITPEIGVKINVTKKISFDKWDRYYFGLTGAIHTSGNNLALSGTESIERNSIIKLGPIISYDAYKTQNYRLTLATGFTYNYLRNFIKLRSDLGSEERLFSGFALSPFTSLYIQAMDIFPNFDLIAGADLNFILPYTLKSDSTASLPDLWSTTQPNTLNNKFKMQSAFLLGIQYRY